MINYLGCCQITIRYYVQLLPLSYRATCKGCLPLVDAPQIESNMLLRSSKFTKTPCSMHDAVTREPIHPVPSWDILLGRKVNVKKVKKGRRSRKVSSSRRVSFQGPHDRK